jgi:glycosyltransferase involved in cell wall biosynthesis
VADRIAVIPPWPLDDGSPPLPDAAADRPRNAFRAGHGLDDAFVVMYSGNHSEQNPLTTLLEAARGLRDDPRFVFALVGGGVAKAPFEAAARSGELPNLLLLPYQPLDGLGELLAAADIHIVAMGDAMVGCVHPCKFYGALAADRPVLLIGPAECHVTEVFARADCGWRIAHGDAAGMVALLLRLAAPAALGELRAKAAAGREALAHGLSRDALRARWADEVETAILEAT